MELTVENVYRVLESTEYTAEQLNNRSLVRDDPNKFKASDYRKVITLLLDTFFSGYTIKEMEFYPEPGLGGMCNLNERAKNKLFKDATEISFVNFYAHIITKLNRYVNKHSDIDPYDEEEWEEDEGDFFNDEIVWNIDEFPTLFKFLLDNKKEIKKISFEKNDQKVYYLVKIILNFTFGTVHNPHSFLKCTNRDSIADSGRKIMKYFLDKYPHHIIYIDTDTIWFSAYDEIKDEVDEKLKDVDMDYDTENHSYFFISEKKHYLIIDNPENIKSIGTKPIDNFRIYNETLERNREKIRERIRERTIEKWDRLGLLSNNGNLMVSGSTTYNSGFFNSGIGFSGPGNLYTI